MEKGKKGIGRREGEEGSAHMLVQACGSSTPRSWEGPLLMFALGHQIHSHPLPSLLLVIILLSYQRNDVEEEKDKKKQPNSSLRHFSSLPNISTFRKQDSEVPENLLATAPRL